MTAVKSDAVRGKRPLKSSRACSSCSSTRAASSASRSSKRARKEREDRSTQVIEDVYREAVLTAPRSGGLVVYKPGAAGARRVAKPPGHTAGAGGGSLSTSRSQRGRGCRPSG